MSKLDLQGASEFVFLEPAFLWQQERFHMKTPKNAD
jgi:hypothetical protein